MQFQLLVKAKKEMNKQGIAVGAFRQRCLSSLNLNDTSAGRGLPAEVSFKLRLERWERASYVNNVGKGSR